MTGTTAPRSPLVSEVLSGKNRDLQLLAAQGILPLPPEELVSVQVELTANDDVEVASAAEQSLAAVDPLGILPYLKQEASPQVVAWFARHARSPHLLEAVLQRRDLGAELACEIAPSLSGEMQEILLLRQDLIVEHPEVLEAIERNPSLSAFAKRRIAEYRRHLVAREEAATEPVEEEVVEEPAPEDDPELQAAIEEVKSTVEAEGEFDQATGLTEAQIKALPPPLRTKLARGASRTLRAILIRDTNPIVAKAVLTASAITESEIEQVSNSRAVAEEVLGAIANNREWMRKYSIVQNLAKNPRTPVGVAVRLAARLSVRDLGLLAKDRNVSDPVRQNARRILATKRK